MVPAQKPGYVEQHAVVVELGIEGLGESKQHAVVCP